MSHGTKLSCPNCNASMTANKQLRVGKHIQCPKCQSPFDVTEERVHDAPAVDGNAQMGILDSAKVKRNSTTDVLQSRPYSPPSSTANRKSIAPKDARDDARKNRLIMAATIGAIVLVAGGLFALSFVSTDPEPKPMSPVAQQQVTPNEHPLPNPPVEKLPNPLPQNSQEQNVEPQKLEVLPLPAPEMEKAKQKPAPKPMPAPKPQQIEKIPPPHPVEVKAQPQPEMPKKKAFVRSTLPPALQKKVDKAIDDGVAFLKKIQPPSGTWPQLRYLTRNQNPNPHHLIGYAALPGLTLLECGVEPDDPTVQRAAQFVRLNSAQLTKTYSLALAILFLDRLGDVRDRPLIQSLALRLVIGQQTDGGWGYDCRVLSSSDMVTLHLALLKTRKVGPPFPDPLLKYAGGIPKVLDTGPFPKLKKLIAENKGDLGPRQPAQPKMTPVRTSVDPKARLLSLPYPNIPRQHVLPAAASQQLAKLYFNPPEEMKGEPDPKQNANPRPAPRPQQNPGPMQDPRVKRLMTLVFSTPPGRARQKLLRQLEKMLVKQARGGKSRSDNSNSQFALLGLWAARRHGVPTAKALMNASIRYMATQNADGGWGYTKSRSETRPAMAGVGLLGLAMGHGVAAELKQKLKQLERVKDIAIHRGLQKFALFIDNNPNVKLRSNRGLYFMWTVERVAVLYNLKTIGGKDWYKWGVEILLPNQSAGSWHMGVYPGNDAVIDTCFALLFLKRSNLVQDLTENLRYYLTLTESETKSQNPE